LNLNNNVKAAIKLEMSKDRDLKAPEFLLDSVKTFDQAGIKVQSNSDLYKSTNDYDSIPYKLMKGPIESCREDALQASYSNDTMAAQPQNLHATWISKDKKIELKMQGLTSFDFKRNYTVSTFDFQYNTMFVEATEVSIRGLIPATTLIIKGESTVNFSPTHHNLGYEITADLWSGKDISSEIIAKLKKQNIRYLYYYHDNLKNKGELFGISEDGKIKNLIKNLIFKKSNLNMKPKS
jgi:hypothetical protein